MFWKFPVIFIVIVLGIFCESNGADSVCNGGSNAEDIAFIRLGKYRGLDGDGSEYQKSYFMSRYIKAYWSEAKAICNSFNLQLASFETLTEANNFLDILDKNNCSTPAGQMYYIVDGVTNVPKSKTEWFWTNTGRKVSYSLPWEGIQPDFFLNKEYCMSIGRSASSGPLGFNDFPCTSDPRQFVCQKIDFCFHC